MDRQIPPFGPCVATTITLARAATPITVSPARSAPPSALHVSPPSVLRMIPVSALPWCELLTSPMPATRTASAARAELGLTVGSRVNAPIDMLGPRSSSGFHGITPIPAPALSVRQTPPLTVAIHMMDALLGSVTTV